MLLICEFINFPALTGITTVWDDHSEYVRYDKAYSVYRYDIEMSFENMFQIHSKAVSEWRFEVSILISATCLINECE